MTNKNQKINQNGVTPPNHILPKCERVALVEDADELVNPHTQITLENYRMCMWTIPMELREWCSNLPIMLRDGGRTGSGVVFVTQEAITLH